MNMKKILLAGIAVGALASTGANAATITGARVSGINLFAQPTGSTSTAPRPITIATDAIYDATRNTAVVSTLPGFAPGAVATSSNSYTATLNTGLGNPTIFAPIPGAGNSRNFKVTFALDGAGDPRFTSALAQANFVPTYSATNPVVTACVVSTFIPTAGGVVNGNFVTANFTVTDITGSGCSTVNAPNGVALIDAPIRLTALGAANMTVTFRNPGDDTIFDAPAASVALAQLANVYDVAATSVQNGTGFGNGAVVPTVFAIGTGATLYTAILSATGYDANIGAIKATYQNAAAALAANASTGVPLNVTTPNTVATFFAGLATTGLPTIAPAATFTNVGGNFSALIPAVAGLTVTAVLPDRTTATGTAAASALGLAAVNVTATTVGANTTSVSTPQSTTVAIRAVPTGTVLNASATVSSALETVGQQGTVITAPWFGGSRAFAPSFVRLSSSTGTGAVSVTLNNPVYQNGDTPGATTCPNAFTSIPAGGEVVIDVTKATSCFGNFRRGDLQIVVNGSQVGLTAKMRVANPDGSTSEFSLSNLPSGQVTSN
jgi:hypothetical protein